MAAYKTLRNTTCCENNYSYSSFRYGIKIAIVLFYYLGLFLRITNPTAFLFDLNGTMVKDMKYHITAWHRIVNQLGAGISLE